MRSLILTAGLGCILGLCKADADIKLPKTPVIPQPLPDVNTTVNLTSDMVYCVDSDVECVVISSPKNKLRIEAKKGPIVVRGKFIDSSTDKIEYREFKGPFLYFVEPNENGLCELLVLPVGGKEDTLIRRSINANVAPRPPPIPPDPKPKPKPEPDPVVKDVAWVIMIEETSQRTPEIATFNSHFTTGNGKTKINNIGIQYRSYDKDSLDAITKKYLDVNDGVGDVGSLPALLFLDRTGRKLKSMKLPATANELEKILGVN